MGSRDNILITAIGGDIGQSVIQCLLETEYANRLCGCDMDPYAAGKALLKRSTISPPVNEQDAYGKFILKVIEDMDVRYIYPISEKEISYFAGKSDYYRSLGIKILTLRPDLINILLDKYDSIQYLRKNGFLVPRTYLIKDFDGKLDFPLILKSRQTCGGKGMVEVNNKEEMSFYIKKDPQAIVQEVIGNIDDEYTVGVFSDNKNVYSIAFKRKLGYGSMTKYAWLVQDDEFRILAENIARTCGLEGPLNIQLRKTSKGLIPFEINPRISSTAYFRNHFGFKDVKWWLDLYHGKDIVYKPEYHAGIAVRTIGAVYYEEIPVN